MLKTERNEKQTDDTFSTAQLQIQVEAKKSVLILKVAAPVSTRDLWNHEGKLAGPRTTVYATWVPFACQRHKGSATKVGPRKELDPTEKPQGWLHLEVRIHRDRKPNSELILCFNLT